MQFKRSLVSYFSIFMIFFLLITSGCKQQYSLKSTWRDKEITIDGIDRDWKDKSRYFDEKTNTKIALYNDNEYLYLCLESMNPVVRRSILRRGFTMWICKTKKTETVWGLRYPSTIHSLEEVPEPGEFDKDREPGEPDNVLQPPEFPPFGGDENDNLNMFVDDAYLILSSNKEPGRP